jgi:transposase-like protein
MPKSRFNEAQIILILKALNDGATFTELGRRYDIHPNTVRAWRTKYIGDESNRAEQLRCG